MPFWGTCMGMIVAAHDVAGLEQPTLDLLDITVRRNAFGRQIASAEVALAIPALGREPFPAVFIRAPWIERAGPGVEVLADARRPRRVWSVRASVLGNVVPSRADRPTARAPLLSRRCCSTRGKASTAA